MKGIPTKFMLMGRTITVKIVPDLVQRQNNTGEAHYRFDEILIQDSTPGCQRTDEQLMQTFLHELFHWIFYHAADEKYTGQPNDNDSFVDRCASLLHQVFVTAEFAVCGEEPRGPCKQLRINHGDGLATVITRLGDSYTERTNPVDKTAADEEY